MGTGTVYRLVASEDGCAYERAAGVIGYAGGYEWVKSLAVDLAECGVYARVVKHWTHRGRPQRKTLHQATPRK